MLPQKTPPHAVISTPSVRRRTMCQCRPLRIHVSRLGSPELLILRICSRSGGGQAPSRQRIKTAQTIR
jgi:hypothetical protein